MKYILIPQSFQRYTKKFRRYFQEKDLVIDVKGFTEGGFQTRETFLKEFEMNGEKFKIVKLRVAFQKVNFRYLMCVINDEKYMPFIIDLKKGPLGRNLSLNTSRNVVQTIEQALYRAIDDYASYPEDNNRMIVYSVK